ncbi:hypothetical protein EI427_17875 [Flammeovirga pectinis]|uniref:PUMA/OVT1 coiled-coil region domain-containing protein n=1 Tax=Flammeovirga pectinis TaxID=2494373 RepID=A0A3Q9FSB8_9BACT|nr:hypothetical protein [Flammeovirga pectinis]AZQ64027.1 hypothetical protein EI427_17875 [Flammeovirga pectinis]
MKNKIILIGICLSTVFVSCKKDKEIVTEVQEVVVKDKTALAENKDLKAKLDAISKKEAELKKRVELLSDQSSQLENDNKEHQKPSGKVTQDLNNKIKQLENDNQKLTDQVNNQKNSSNQNNKIKQLEAENQQLKNQQTVDDKTIITLNGKVKTVEDLLKQLQLDNSQLKLDEKGLNDIITALQSKTKKLTDDVEANINKLKATESKLTDSDTKLSSSNSNNTLLSKEIVTLKKAIAEQKKKYDVLTNQVKLLEDKIKQLEDEKKLKEEQDRLEEIKLAKKILPLYIGKKLKELPLNHKIVGYDDWEFYDYVNIIQSKTLKRDDLGIVLLLIKGNTRYQVNLHTGKEDKIVSFNSLRRDQYSHIVNGVRMIKDQHKPFNKLNSSGIVVERNDFAKRTKFDKPAPFEIVGLEKTILIDGNGKVYNKLTDKWESGKTPATINGRTYNAIELTGVVYDFVLDVNDYITGTGNGKVAKTKPANYPNEDDIIGYDTPQPGVKNPIYLRDIRPEIRAISDHEFLLITKNGEAIFGTNVMKLVNP